MERSSSGLKKRLGQFPAKSKAFGGVYPASKRLCQHLIHFIAANVVLFFLVANRDCFGAGFAFFIII